MRSLILLTFLALVGLSFSDDHGQNDVHGEVESRAPLTAKQKRLVIKAGELLAQRLKSPTKSLMRRKHLIVSLIVIIPIICKSYNQRIPAKLCKMQQGHN